MQREVQALVVPPALRELGPPEFQRDAAGPAAPCGRRIAERRAEIPGGVPAPSPRPKAAPRLSMSVASSAMAHETPALARAGEVVIARARAGTKAKARGDGRHGSSRSFTAWHPARLERGIRRRPLDEVMRTIACGAAQKERDRLVSGTARELELARVEPGLAQHAEVRHPRRGRRQASRMSAALRCVPEIHANDGRRPALHVELRLHGLREATRRLAAPRRDFPPQRRVGVLRVEGARALGNPRAPSWRCRRGLGRGHGR